jgi:hypothetical protein
MARVLNLGPWQFKIFTAVLGNNPESQVWAVPLSPQHLPAPRPGAELKRQAGFEDKLHAITLTRADFPQYSTYFETKASKTTVYAAEIYLKMQHLATKCPQSEAGTDCPFCEQVCRLACWL